LSNERRREVPIHRILNDFVILRAAKKNADAWVLMSSFAITIKRFKVESELAHVFRFETAGFQLKSDKASQITMVEKEVQLKILISDLHPNLLSYKCEAVAELHQKLSQVEK
jgi:hypothetical protein